MSAFSTDFFIAAPRATQSARGDLDAMARQSDLSAIALSMAFVSTGYAVLWLVLEFRLVRQIWRSAQFTPPLRSSSHKRRQLELVVAASAVALVGN
jgi:hypothetical protein